MQKAKGEEQRKLLPKYYSLSKDFAEKFYKLAEDNAKDPVAADALFWVMQNGAESSVYQKAVERATALVADMPLKDLAQRLKTMRGGNPKLMEVAFERRKSGQRPRGRRSAGLDRHQWQQLPGRPEGNRTARPTIPGSRRNRATLPGPRPTLFPKGHRDAEVDF